MPCRTPSARSPGKGTEEILLHVARKLLLQRAAPLLQWEVFRIWQIQIRLAALFRRIAQTHIIRSLLDRLNTSRSRKRRLRVARGPATAVC
jgi:hypothetical protein